MNILFISSMPVKTLADRGIFPDLVRCLSKRGHSVTSISAAERKTGEETRLIQEGNASFLRVKTLNNIRASLFEKAFSVLLTPLAYHMAINKHLRGKHFDLILCTTPPVTVCSLIAALKRRHGCPVYLMLKDLWPEAMEDIGLAKRGSPQYRFFRRKAEKMYKTADFIGTMSAANTRVLLENYPFLNPQKVEECPNSLEPTTIDAAAPEELSAFRAKYGIPPSATLFVYGGSFNIVQGIGFLVNALKLVNEVDNIFVLLCGEGNDRKRLEAYLAEAKPRNVLLLPYLPKDEYYTALGCADVGLVLLNHKCNVPNIPSRTLDYMLHRLPILSASDEHTDYRHIINENRLGFAVLSVPGNEKAFVDAMNSLHNEETRNELGENARKYLETVWNSEKTAETILKHFNSGECQHQ